MRASSIFIQLTQILHSPGHVAKNTITVKIVQWTVFTVIGSLTGQNLQVFLHVNRWHGFGAHFRIWASFFNNLHCLANLEQNFYF